MYYSTGALSVTDSDDDYCVSYIVTMVDIRSCTRPPRLPGSDYLRMYVYVYVYTYVNAYIRTHKQLHASVIINKFYITFKCSFV